MNETPFHSLVGDSIHQRFSLRSTIRHLIEFSFRVQFSGTITMFNLYKLIKCIILLVSFPSFFLWKHVWSLALLLLTEKKWRPPWGLDNVIPDWKFYCLRFVLGWRCLYIVSGCCLYHAEWLMGLSMWLNLTDPFPAIKSTVSPPFQNR